jgi:hypothetical protein
MSEEDEEGEEEEESEGREEEKMSTPLLINPRFTPTKPNEKQRIENRRKMCCKRCFEWRTKPLEWNKKTIKIIAIQKSSMANREKLISHTNQTQYKCSYVTITQYLFFEMENTIPFCRVSNVKTSVGASYFFSLCRQSDAFVPVKSIVMGNFSSFQCFYFLCYKQ